MGAPSIVLYTRKKCPLCEEGKAALELATEMLNLTFSEVDIDQDERLLEIYQLMIPAITLNGELIAAGQVNMEALLENLTKLRS